jgi:hypothetical protein
MFVDGGNVEMWLVDAFRAPRDNHINIASLTFVLHLLPATLTATSNAYPSSNTLINHLLAQVRACPASMNTIPNYVYFLPPDDPIHLSLLVALF